MGTFKSTKILKAPASQIPGIAAEIEIVLKSEGYEVTRTMTANHCHISVTKGSTFKAVLGMKTALNVEIRPRGNVIFIEAGVGIFGQQAIPTIVSVFFLWPVLITQIWGMVQQSKLDDHVIEIAENYIAQNNISNVTATNTGQFCTSCGNPLMENARFCAICGTKL